jgi:hypothetical protein
MWIEYSGGEVFARYKFVKHEHGSVFIRDNDRRMTVKITNTQIFFRTDFDLCFFLFGDGHWQIAPTFEGLNFIFVYQNRTCLIEIPDLTLVASRADAILDKKEPLLQVRPQNVFIPISIIEENKLINDLDPEKFIFIEEIVKGSPPIGRAKTFPKGILKKKSSIATPTETTAATNFGVILKDLKLDTSTVASNSEPKEENRLAKRELDDKSPTKTIIQPNKIPVIIKIKKVDTDVDHENPKAAPAASAKETTSSIKPNLANSFIIPQKNEKNSTNNKSDGLEAKFFKYTNERMLQNGIDEQQQLKLSPSTKKKEIPSTGGLVTSSSLNKRDKEGHQASRLVSSIPSLEKSAVVSSIFNKKSPMMTASMVEKGRHRPTIVNEIISEALNLNKSKKFFELNFMEKSSPTAVVAAAATEEAKSTVNAASQNRVSKIPRLVKLADSKKIKIKNNEQKI